MKIVGISGSPRAKGNTEILVQEALRAASEVGAKQELIALSGKKSNHVPLAGHAVLINRKEYAL